MKLNQSSRDELIDATAIKGISTTEVTSPKGDSIKLPDYLKRRLDATAESFNRELALGPDIKTILDT
jgi:hypothetical protein